MKELVEKIMDYIKGEYGIEIHEDVLEGFFQDKLILDKSRIEELIYKRGKDSTSVIAKAYIGLFILDLQSLLPPKDEDE